MKKLTQNYKQFTFVSDIDDDMTILDTNVYHDGYDMPLCVISGADIIEFVIDATNIDLDIAIEKHRI